MKFFVPAANDKEQEARVYEAIKEFLGKELGALFNSRKVFYLSYVHNGQKYTAEVGQQHAINGEPVIAILYEPGRRLYHVCTPNRGVIRGMSILVGENLVNSVRDFE